MRKYFYILNNEKKGPFSLTELQKEGINIDTLIWYQGLEIWTKAENISEIKEILYLIPPPFIDEKIRPTNKCPYCGKYNLKDSVKCECGYYFKKEHYNQASKSENNKSDKSIKDGNPIVIVLGFTLAFFGMYPAILFGMNYAFRDYEKTYKIIGWAIMILTIVAAVLWKSVNL